ncbi:type I-E CRISPR-associated protein Cas6/Cse3/CasE [Streptomyces sp. B21-088]
MTSLTRIALNPHNLAVRADLADVDSLHKTLMRLVPDHNSPTPRAAAGLLFRTESGPDPTLLVQTAHVPDLINLPADYGTARTVDLTPLLNSLTPGRTVRYRITAAPTVARSAGNPNRHPVTGKRRGKITHLTGTKPSPGGRPARKPSDFSPPSSPAFPGPSPAPASPAPPPTSSSPSSTASPASPTPPSSPTP